MLLILIGKCMSKIIFANHKEMGNFEINFRDIKVHVLSCRVLNTPTGIRVYWMGIMWYDGQMTKAPGRREQIFTERMKRLHVLFIVLTFDTIIIELNFIMFRINSVIGLHQTDLMTTIQMLRKNRFNTICPICCHDSNNKTIDRNEI